MIGAHPRPGVERDRGLQTNPKRGESMAALPPPTNLQEVIDRMPKQFNAAAAQGFKAVYQYCISGAGGKDFYADIDNGKFNLGDGKHGSPSITVSVAHDDFLKMLSDPSAAQMLFMQGKISVNPLDLSLMMKLQTLFPNT
jgi:putative sterol carrier protein